MIRRLLEGDALKRWRARLLTAVVIWGLIVLVLGGVDADPRPLPLAAVVGAATIGVSLVLDLGAEPPASPWPTTPLPTSQPSDDPRVRRLQQLIESARTDDARSEPIRRILRAVAAERVAARFGITEGSAPERYEEILGRDLAAWLDDGAPDAAAPPINHRELVAVLQRIEAL